MKGSSLRCAVVAALTSSAFLLTSCGDVYRPVANPIPQSGGPQPAAASFALALSNTGSTTQGILSAFNLPGDSNMGQIAVGIDAVHAMTPDGTRAFVANRGNDSVTEVFPFSTPTAASTLTIALFAGSAPVFVASDGVSLWTANSGRSTMGVVNLSNNSQTTEVPVAPGPSSILNDAANSKIYVISKSSNKVTIISSKDYSVLATLSVGASPVQAVVSTVTGRVYVLNQGSGTLTEIDPSLDTVLSTITVGANPSRIAYDNSIRKLLVTNTGSNTLSVIDADVNSPNFAQVVNVPVGTAPSSVAILGTSHRAIVANSGSNDLTVVDTLSNRALIASIPVGTQPISVTAASDGSKAIVASAAGSSVTIIETTHYSVTLALNVPPTPVLVGN